jgi:hypothetical protein
MDVAYSELEQVSIPIRATSVALTNKNACVSVEAVGGCVGGYVGGRESKEEEHWLCGKAVVGQARLDRYQLFQLLFCVFDFSFNNFDEKEKRVLHRVVVPAFLGRRSKAL